MVDAKKTSEDGETQLPEPETTLLDTVRDPKPASTVEEIDEDGEIGDENFA